MKVQIPRHHSRAIARIGEALCKHKPAGVETSRIPSLRKDSRAHWLSPGEDDGDMVVLLCNGLRDHHMAQAQRCIQRGQKYAVVQIALRTTRYPSTEQWRDLWRGAAVVWTYYPLEVWIKEDGGVPIDFPFLRAPLGVDSEVFRPRSLDRDITICTSGAKRNHESVAECDDAVAAVNGHLFQLGPTLATRARTTFATGINDDELALMYSRCQFVSGLRKEEGFELPAAEGLLCGARPVVYDQPHYRVWYDGLADFIQETNRREITDQLTKLFSRGPRPASEAEIERGVRLFNWSDICRRFWEMATNA